MRIDTRVAERLSHVHPSTTLALNSKAKKLKAEGKDVISFAAGEPDFDTPDFVKAAAIRAINSGFTKYTPTTGTLELKRLIAEKFQRENGIPYSPEQIVVSNGAKHSIFNALTVLVDPGDEVLIPSPYWVSYSEMVSLCQGIPKFIKTSAAHSFKTNDDEIGRHLGPKTKVLILNSPSNPTGSVYTKQELEKIAALCVENKVFIISDEIYEHIMYEGMQHFSVASIGEKVRDLTVTVNGVSKSFSMTGWRIGYCGAPPDIAEAIGRLQDHTTSNASSISQKAAEAALAAPDAFVKEMCREFEKRRDRIVALTEKMPKLGVLRPQGAFYLFCDISKTRLDSSVFAQRLLEEALVAVIPGGPFGRDDYVRISFATGIPEIEKGMERLDAWLKRL